MKVGEFCKLLLSRSNQLILMIKLATHFDIDIGLIVFFFVPVHPVSLHFTWFWTDALWVFVEQTEEEFFLFFSY